MTKEGRVRLRALGFLCASLGLVLGAGCVSTNVSVDKALSSLRAGDDPSALAWSEKLKHSFYSKNLGYLETGRVRMLSGDFLGSSTNFAAVIDQIIDKSEAGPVIKIGSVGANVMAGTVTDDRTRAYEVPPYEFIQSLHYQMLNDVFLGNIEAAGVEARRAVFAQDAIAEKYGKEVQEAAQASASDAKNAAALGKVDAQMQSMAPVIEMTRSSFENGLAWYLCGVLFEQQDDLSNASLSYRKAWELAPGNPYVQRDFLRLLRTQDQETYKGLVAQAGIDPKTLVRNRTEVILIVEESFVSQRQSVKVPLPIPGINTLTSVDFPMYQDPAYQPMALEVREKENTCGLSAMALSVQSLAYRDLKEKIPGIVIRNVTRVTTRLVAQQVANQGNDYVKFGVMAFNAVSAVINKADTRAWYTLPMVTHLFRSGVAPGEHLFELRNQVTGYVTRFPVKVAEGETRVIWVADIGGNARVATASLNGKGGPTTFQVSGSMLAGVPAMIVPGGPKLIGQATPAAPAVSEPSPQAAPAPAPAPQAVAPAPAPAAVPAALPVPPVQAPVPAPVEQPIIIPMPATTTSVAAPPPAPVAAAPKTAPAASVAKPSLQSVPPAVRLPGERGLSVTHAKGANWGVPPGGMPLQLVGEKKGYK